MWRATSFWSRALAWPGRRFGRYLGPVVAVLLLGALSATPTSAFEIDSTQVVVPVVVHTHGYNSTVWKSDVWVTNTGSPAGEFTLTYYPAAGGKLTRSMTIAGYGGQYFSDIVLQTFGLNDSKGLLVVSSPSVYMEVRARVYNTGDPAGQFGQAVPGIPQYRLSRQGFISGVSTAAGNRLSVGIANPTDRTFDVDITVRDVTTQETLSDHTVTLSPHELLQLDKVAELWNLPARDDLAIDTNPVGNDNADVFYAYASVVRDDTGDATFLFGTAPNAGVL
ncbi:MAG: hypothetical protein LJE95_11960 [Acidobacteria bacterium]|nr:hypothetical protein [Acidobacteriota bacterium]